MPDHESTGSGRQGGSLLSLGDRAAPRASGKDNGSILQAAGAREPDRAMQHKLARSRREARPNPLLHALAARPGPGEQSQEEIDADVAAELDADFDVSEKIRERARRRYGSKFNTAQSGEDMDYNAVRGEPEFHHREAAEYGDPRPLIDPIKVVGGIMRSKRLIAATTIAGALTGVMIALSTPKHYEAVGEILIDPRNIKLVDRELVSSSVSQSTEIAIVENHVRVMTSGAVVAKVVERLNLDTDPEFNGSQSSFGLRSLISELRSLLSRSDSNSGGGRSHAIAVQNLLEKLEVARSGKTFVVTVGVISQSPEKSALIANTVVDVFMDYSGSSFTSTATRAADELGAKLEDLRNGVEVAERKVETFKGERDLIDARGHLIGDDEIIRINDQLSIARARTIELSAKAASARSLDADSVLGGALPEGVNSGLITELRTQYAELLRRANQASVKYGAKHPESLAIEAQLDGARAQLRGELQRIVASMQIELKRAVQLEQKLASRLAELKARQVNVSDDMVTLRELERDAATKRTVYESYLLRARETGELKDLNSANMSIISPASPPLEPMGPSRSVIAIAGTMAGFLLGIGLGGVRGAVDGMFGGPPAGPRRPRRSMPSPGNRRDRAGWERQRPDDRDDGEEYGSRPPAAERYGSGGTPTHQPPAPATAASVYGPPPYPSAAYPVAPAYPAFGLYGMPPYPPVVPPFWPQFGPQYGPQYGPQHGMPMMPHPAYQPVPMPGYAYPPPQAGTHAQEAPQPDANRRSANAGPDVAASRRKPRNKVEAIRDDLREVRSAIHDLADRRARRRG